MLMLAVNNKLELPKMYSLEVIDVTLMERLVMNTTMTHLERALFLRFSRRFSSFYLNTRVSIITVFEKIQVII
eukprot:snap_masked-scaffold_2-processed-gene-0.49-mRNA-1 protein AED:1.00 eAED:1.00 QI:0/0/0/0/1/1/2/0/72